MGSCCYRGLRLLLLHWLLQLLLHRMAVPLLPRLLLPAWCFAGSVSCCCLRACHCLLLPLLPVAPTIVLVLVLSRSVSRGERRSCCRADRSSSARLATRTAASASGASLKALMLELPERWTGMDGAYQRYGMEWVAQLQ
jgi:hypothetical protein